jgi:hypothetical protein
LECHHRTPTGADRDPLATARLTTSRLESNRSRNDCLSSAALLQTQAARTGEKMGHLDRQSHLPGSSTSFLGRLPVRLAIQVAH